jgi:hypothetical protein
MSSAPASNSGRTGTSQRKHLRCGAQGLSGRPWRHGGARTAKTAHHTETSDAASKDSILSALDLATNRMRRQLGEPEASLKKFNVPANKQQLHRSRRSRHSIMATKCALSTIPDAAIASFKLAIDLDPQFALAYARLGTIYQNRPICTQP